MEARKDKSLAEGEVTGHAHTATARDAVVFGEGVERELETTNGTGVTHQEHKEIQLPAGQYNISRQQEIDPDTEELRTVSD